MFTVENLVGGSGNDTFKGSVPHNTFTCGPGQDAVTTDATDTVAGCETVNGVTTDPPAAPVGSVSKLKPKAKAKGAKVTIDTGATAACPATATGAARSRRRPRPRSARRPSTLGKLAGKAGTVAAGTSLRVKLKVSRKKRSRPGGRPAS